MPELILTVGVSASGKTTWANTLDDSWVNINRDDVRFELFTDGIRDWTKYRFTNKNEREVTEECLCRANLAVNSGKNIIISDTNINPSIRDNWKEFAEAYGYDYSEMLFPCDWDTLVKRNNQREGGISQSVLWSQYKRYMQQFGMIGELPIVVYEHNNSLPSTIIVDIDGTLAEMKGIRKPYEWDKVGLDRPRQEIIDMVLGLASFVGNILFMSGRDGQCYYDTLHWLETNIMQSHTKHINWDLVMRSKGDSRKDWIVKYELYHENVLGKYNVAAVFDDRAQVLRLWDLLELPNVVNVGGYNNEF